MPAPLNASLATKALQGNIEGEGAALPEVADALIVALPLDAKVKTVVFVIDAQPEPHRLKAVGVAGRVFNLAGKVEYRCGEHRPIVQEFEPTRDPELFLVAQILDRGADVAVEAEVADLDVTLLGAGGEIDL